MNSPFPGMDPYIEACGLSEDFNGHLMGEMSGALADMVPRRYLIRTGQRRYIISMEEEHREPFVEIRELQPFIERIYQRFRYDESIDYAKPLPPPPLKPDEAAWIKKHLR